MEATEKSEFYPRYTKYQLATRLVTFCEPDARMAASEDGWYPQIRQRMIDACEYYSIDLPYWLS